MKEGHIMLKSHLLLLVDFLRGVSGHVRRYGAGTAQGWDNLAQFTQGDVIPRHMP